MFQRQISARRLLKDRPDYLSQVKAHKSALDESRQNLSNQIDNAYYASHNGKEISTVEYIITEINSTVPQMSQRINSLAATDNDLAKQDSSLINERSPHINRSLHTRISCLQHREVTATLKNKK